MRLHLRLLAALAAAALTAACGISFQGGEPEPPTPAASPPATTPPTTTPPTTPTTAETAPPGASPPEDLREQPRVTAAIADTATREGVDPAQVVVAAWSPVTWSDGSLGCPQPGMSYTQATVDGELLILRVGEGLFQYHARTGGPFTYCADPSAGYTVG